MKYFNNDGFCVSKENKLDALLISRLGKAISKYCKNSNIKKIIIGKTNFEPSDYVFSILSTQLLKSGIEIDDIGICLSPAVAYLAKKFSYKLGIMLVQSNENVYIKFFNSNGEIATADFENEIERFVDKTFYLKQNKFSQVHNQERLKTFYIAEIKNLIKFDNPIVIDCGEQKYQTILQKIFPSAHKVFNCSSNLDMLKSICQKKSMIGISLNADSSRLTMVSENGKILNSDDIVFVLSKFFLRANDNLVITKNFNEKLKENLKARNINLIQTETDEKNIIKTIKENSSILGGDNLGTIILKKYTNTSDAILISIILLNILSLSKTSLDELINSADKTN